MSDPTYRFVRPDHEHHRFLRLIDWFGVVSCVYLVDGWAIARTTDNDLLLWMVGATAVLGAGFGLGLVVLEERRRGVAILAAVAAATVLAVGWL